VRKLLANFACSSNPNPGITADKTKMPTLKGWAFKG
jgi:hypothetical protein